ncbi:MAG: hypothetical protein LBU84_08410 [Prevotella sp.]|jgi:serine/threonine protein phosphatase PrpC|nr:hypothetical protein [Prevotella sp.]
MVDLSFSIYTEKLPGKGEDADPLLIVKEDYGVLGVFDGLGGAGSFQYEEDGIIHTGAYYSSRAIRKTVSDFFNEINIYLDEYFEKPDRQATNLKQPMRVINFIFSELVGSLQRNMRRDLSMLIKRIEKEPPKIKGNLIKRLPTTAVIIFYQKELTARNMLFLIIWAGDSRGYILDKYKGLMQITKDDSKTEGDAFDNLKEDSPMSNYIHIEDNSFILNKNTFTHKIPSILIVATDGCFHYLDTPMCFECILLTTMRLSKSIQEWKYNIEFVIKQITEDDATLSLITIGYDNFEILKYDFSKRFTFLKGNFIDPLSDIKGKYSSANGPNSNTIDKKEFNDKIKRVWDKYKRPYEHFIIRGNK